MKINDQVTYMSVKSIKNSFRLSAKKGKIIEIGATKALIQKPNGRKEWISKNDLTPEGQKNAVTKIFEAFSEAVTA